MRTIISTVMMNTCMCKACCQTSICCTCETVCMNKIKKRFRQKQQVLKYRIYELIFYEDLRPKLLAKALKSFLVSQPLEWHRRGIAEVGGSNPSGTSEGERREYGRSKRSNGNSTGTNQRLHRVHKIWLRKHHYSGWQNHPDRQK